MNLDKIGEINKLDQNQVGESIRLLPRQIKQVWEENKNLKLPVSYKNFGNVVVDGMGGSNLGARIVRAVFENEIKAPIVIKAGYELPACIGKDTLYILSSYSGTTEETLSTIRESMKRGAKMAVLSVESAKSTLKQIAVKEHLPLITFDPKNNPSGQPRLGVGYSVAGILAYFIKSGLVKINPEEFRNVLSRMTAKNKKYSPEIKVRDNPAKKLALELKGKIPVLVSGNFLEGNMHALRNQINESGKNFACYLILPELNHYAMEGLAHPQAKKHLHFVFFDSDLENKRVKIRSELTKKVVKGDKIGYSAVKLAGKTRFEQGMEVLQFGSWLSYYLGLLNNENPVEVKWVDWFKRQLSTFNN